MGALFDEAWKEAIRSGTSASSMSMNSASATLSGYIDPDKLTNPECFAEILGGCVVDGKGGLYRKLPIANPEYPWMFASNLQLKGVGFDEKTTSPAVTFEAEPISEYAKYKTYEYNISFSPRPYVLLKNQSIPIADVTYYDTNGVSQTKINVPAEYYRYTEFEENPTAEYITAQHGELTFNRSDALSPNGQTVPGHLRILQNRSTIKFRWYQVPYSYITSTASYIKAAQGKINQTAFYDFPAGTLLLAAFTYVRYTPPNPGTFKWFPGVISNQKLVDIEFIFNYFNPVTLAGGKLPAALPNLNYIAAGHNLMPWLGGLGGTNKGYYYAHGGAEVDSSPIYQSYPYELIFMDPDV